jgi:hypothetical protein
MLPACIALSLALHGLLLVVGLPRLQPGHLALAGRAAARAISVQLVRAPQAGSPAPPQVAQVPPSGFRLDTGDEDTILMGNSADQRAPSPAEGSARNDQPPLAAAVPTQAAAAPSVPQNLVLQATADASATPLSPSLRASDHDDYVPRPLLSVPPLAQAPVLIEAPSDSNDVGRFVGVLSLFIDEQGQVRFITADNPPLPLAMERSAREAFMMAHFAPGQIDGHAVKSKVRVEVVFDNMPLATRIAGGP